MMNNLSRLWAKITGRRVKAPSFGSTLHGIDQIVSAPSYLELFRGLVAYDVVNSRKYRDRLAREDRTHAHSDIVRFADALCTELSSRGVPFFVHGIYRGENEQNRLYSEGHSKARFGSSPHNYGMAADIVHFGRYWELSKKEWFLIGQIGKEVARRLNLKITWGGDWNFYDPAHWELADWRQRARGT